MGPRQAVLSALCILVGSVGQ